MENPKEPKHAKDDYGDLLSYKEKSDLFKMAFRNYLTLVTVADRKAGLLIHVNSIIISVVIAFTIRHMEGSPVFILPTGFILAVAITTIVLSILASRPQEQTVDKESFHTDENLFFGSFDRVDRLITKTKWADYQAKLARILGSDKQEMLMQITQETFLVKKVLGMKFKYISAAYKVFMYGLLVSVVIFLIVLIKFV